MCRVRRGEKEEKKSMTETISICRKLCSGHVYSSFVVVSSAGFVCDYTSFDGLWYVMITITGEGN